ncbi:MAG: hypothetical protein AAGJ84_10820 [Pseudomonadota bacterium]
MRVVRLLASWVLALFLIFMYLQATVHPLPNPPLGEVKLFDRPGENIVFATMAMNTGFAWLEPGGRFVVAVLELIAVVMLLFPAMRKSGAIFSAVILVGAVMAHLSPDILGREVPASLDTADANTDGGALFALAIAMLTASLLLFVVHPSRYAR